MFKIGDFAIHKTAGACIIADIVCRDFGNGEMNYYYLKPKFPNNINKSLEIYLPLDKEAIFIRKPLSKEEVIELIHSIPAMDVYWISDAKTRKLKFEEIYHKGDIKDLCQLVKLLYKENEITTKPMSLTDKTFLNRIKTKADYNRDKELNEKNNGQKQL